MITENESTIDCGCIEWKSPMEYVSKNTRYCDAYYWVTNVDNIYYL